MVQNNRGPIFSVMIKTASPSTYTTGGNYWVDIYRRESVQVRRDSAHLQSSQLEPRQQPGHTGRVPRGIQDVRPRGARLYQRR